MNKQQSQQTPHPHPNSKTQRKGKIPGKQEMMVQVALSGYQEAEQGPQAAGVPYRRAGGELKV